MSKRITNIVMIVCLLGTLASCSEKRLVERRFEGLWEIQLYSQRDYLYWYDTCGYMDQILYFNLDRHECRLPEVERETLEERAKENYVGIWSVSKADTQWTITIKPRKHPLQGVFNISFYKDTVIDSYNRETVRYFMNLKNEDWDIDCKKTGLILHTW